MTIFNTETRKPEPFRPLVPGEVSLYCCGPTVYNYAHIGNLRAFLFEDILVRTLREAGYKVNHVMNITDVGHLTSDGDEGEDKMIKGARERGMTVWDIARFFTDAFIADTKQLNILPPTVTCLATEHISDMIAFVEKLEEKGFTYTGGGNVYFDTSRLGDYGRLAGLKLDELKMGARIEVDPVKRNPQDFVLWFTQSKFDNQAMLWDSPWGRGYPGWHIECSAMSSRYLGSRFDIHCGGIDHIPVHHTNEIAQSEAAFGQKWVNYWMHNEFLVMKEGKMSKSSGGFLTLQKLIDDGYHPLDYRYFLLGGHYRSQLFFSAESLDGARNARQKLVARTVEMAREAKPVAETDLEGAAVEKIRQFRAFLFQDLNTPRALALVWDMLKDDTLSASGKLSVLLAADRILGLDLTGIIEQGDAGTADELEPELRDLIDKRGEARKNKDFALSDKYRDDLLARGIRIKDTPKGTEWTRI
jgi:cysteinyl-tRNA synthetase